MKQTLFLVGPSDIEGQSSTNIEFADAARVTGRAHWEGVMTILPFIMNDPTLKQKSIVGLVGVQSFKAPENARLNLFNLVGDADASIGTLQKIQTIAQEIRPLRHLNRPEDVFKTSRERLQTTLANIPGCRMPNVIACDAKSFGELATACEELDNWPLIIRARGYHRGENMRLLENIAQLALIKDSPWLYQGVLLIQFIDYRNERNLYQKTRVIMVDGVPYPRHSIVSDQHFIHARNRSDLMDVDDELCRQEDAYLAYLRDEGLTSQETGGVFTAIHQRIGLDIFGIDCAVVGGKLVIFEANACMDFLSQDYGRNGRYQYLEPHIRRLKRAVKRLLMNA
jgi:hypothetical protein